MPINMLQTVNIAFAKLPVPPVVPSPGNMQLYFNFENVATNEGTLGGNLTFTNTSNYGYDNGNSKVGSNSLRINGTTGNTTGFVGYPSFTLPATSGFSVSCWFRIHGNTMSGNGYYPVLFYHQGTSLAHERFGFFFAPDNYANTNVIGNILLVCGNSSPGVANQLVIPKTTYENLTYNVSLSGAWNHIGWSINASGSWTVRLNGQNVAYATTTKNLSTISTTNPFYLGQEGNPNFPKMNFNLDAFRLWNISLSSADLLSLYTQGI